MKFNNHSLGQITRRIATDLMPPGTVVERMRGGQISEEQRIFVIECRDNYFNEISIKGERGSWYPELFRVVKEAK